VAVRNLWEWIVLVCVGSEWSRRGRVVDAAAAVVALVVVVVSLLRGRPGNRFVSGRRSCPVVMIRRDPLFAPKEGHHKPVKIETPRLLQ